MTSASRSRVAANEWRRLATGGANDMMEEHGPMSIGMGLVWLLVVAMLGLAVAALVKYLRSGRK
jgi:hypothetical protein